MSKNFEACAQCAFFNALIGMGMGELNHGKPKKPSLQI
jgi:hypothetical protein